MKEKINQKGFIQIPLLIAIIVFTVVTAGAATGVILHKQGKLAPLVASISEVFKVTEPEETQTADIQSKLEQKIAEAEKEEAKAQELEQQAETTEDELEKARLLVEAERARAEAEKARAEAEIAKAEAERLRREVEEAKKLAEESQQTQSEQLLQESFSPTITNVSPNRILINIENYLTISGTNFKQGAEVFIGGINFGVGTIISDNTITIKISPGVLAPNIYDVLVRNMGGKTATLNNALTFASPPSQAPPTSTELTTQEIAAKVSPAVVRIETIDSLGSGMILDSTGFILTNWHVIEGNSIVKVKLEDNRIIDGIVIGWNEIKDLAIVKINSSNLSHVNLGNSDTINPGEKVIVLGYSQPAPSIILPNVSLSDGKITAKQQFESGLLLQTDAQTQPGNSGGPWINTNGEVIGVHLAGIGPKIYGIKVDIGFNFAIPINTAKSIIPNLKAGAKVSIPGPSPEPTPEPEPEPTPEPTVPGTLTVSVDASSPSASILLGKHVGSHVGEQTLVVFRLAANNVEDLDLDNITITVINGTSVDTFFFYSSSRTDGTATSVPIQTASPAVIGSTADATARIDLLDGTVTIPANGNVKITVKAKFLAVGVNTGFSDNTTFET